MLDGARIVELKCIENLRFERKIDQTFLVKNQFSDIKISPITYGPFTNSQIIGYSHLKIKAIHSFLCVILDRIFRFLFLKKFIKYSETNPLFYFVEASLN